MIVIVELERGPNLRQILHAARIAGFAPRDAGTRQDYTSEQTDNCDDNQKLDKREPAMCYFSSQFISAHLLVGDEDLHRSVRPRVAGDPRTH